MATLEREPDVRQLADARFVRMQNQIGRPMEVDDSGLPDGPSWPAWVQTVALLRFRHRFHPYLFAKYGEAATIRLLPHGRPVVIFSRPEHVKEIFAGDPQHFHAGKGNVILGPIMGQHSLLLQDGDEHARARKLLMPAFNGQALRGYRGLVTEIAADEVDGWRPGVEFRALDRMNALTLEVILRVVYGVTDGPTLTALRPRINAVVNVPPAVLLGWTNPWLQRFGMWKRSIQNQYELDELLYAEIRDRRARHDLDDRDDVLSRLLRVGVDAADDAADDARSESDSLSDNELRDQLITLLLAGHETTATALSWALVEAGSSRDLLLRCQTAADQANAGDHGGEQFLEAVLKEAMRLHPVIPMVMRSLTAPARVGGYDIPAGATVGPSIIQAHRLEQSHPAAGSFRPERFLGHNPPPNSWIPFGGGVRRCIGAGFSLMEGVEVLREIFGRFDVDARPGERPKVRNITSVPRHGARITVTERRR